MKPVWNCACSDGDRDALGLRTNSIVGIIRTHDIRLAGSYIADSLSGGFTSSGSGDT
jgi:hypothetical protein